jgi:putative spermidine/putrescine transport system permease protein
LAITRVARPSARILEASFLSPLILPTLSYGLAALMFFSVIGIRPSLNLLIAGHLVVIAPFIFRTTLASLTQLDPALLEASANLGASRFFGFRRITLPLIAPGIAAGCFLAFISSMDNVPVSLFLSNARTGMLPIRMWGMMESTLDVRIAAIAGVLILATLILMIVMDRLTGLTKRISG